MRTRNNDWFDTENKQVLLGIDVSSDGRKWCHLAIDGKPYFAESESTREAMKIELRKKKMS